jgi:hypothetical protein
MVTTEADISSRFHEVMRRVENHPGTRESDFQGQGKSDCAAYGEPHAAPWELCP